MNRLEATIITLLFIGMAGIVGVFANEDTYTNIQLANAIFKAEGGYKATYLYGIRSVTYKDEQDARRICLNTIRNNRKRYDQYGYKQYDTYLEFLASRYCPIGCDNDKGANKYWLRNVLFFLRKESK